MEKTVVRYHFPAVDIVRFFAAISVVVYHCIAHFSWDDFPTKYGMFWFRMGWVGVDIFFVISGFVISLATFSHLDRNGTSSFRIDFMKKRIARIVPLHYLTLIIFIVFSSPALIYKDFIPNILAHLFFVHNLSYITHSDINGVNWSLGAEMQFYLLIALIGPFIKDCKIYKVVLPAIIITYIWRIFIVHNSSTESPQDVFLFFVRATQLPGMLDEFLIGYLLARFVRSASAVRFFKYKYTSVILLTLSVMMVWLFFSIYLKHSSFWPYPYMVVFFRTYIALTVGTIILFLCSLRIGKFGRIILKPFYYGGTISYGIYLWHLPIIISVKEHLSWLSPMQSFTVTIAFTLVIAALSWHFFEKKFLIKKI
ncbi:acyltransferase [Klebsiella aerogenes]|uniref:acyltransferase family protein n=1 Tax=Klebsiella aerogenes TaxID=548 RepID=UPI001C8C5A84|nr:acyltransferase [Klebsiella aerogenes]MBX9000478.1 acyltransferase [Klebsiella aerogenes]